MTRTVWVVTWAENGKIRNEVFDTEAEAQSYKEEHNITGSCAKGVYHSSIKEGL